MTNIDHSAPAIKAHFFVQKAERHSHATQTTFGAVCRGVANAMWAQYTPAGSIQMTILNDAIDLTEGDEYEVTFRKVIKPALGDGHPVVRAVTKNGQIVCETCGHDLGYTEQAVKTYGTHMEQYTTEEHKQKMLAHHDEVYAKRDDQ